jgi:hypothetical protein
LPHVSDGVSMLRGLAVVGGFPDVLLVLILLGVAMALIFAGKSVIKVLAFAFVGLVGASVGAGIGVSWGPPGVLLGAVLGFAVGGVLGLVALAVGVGIALGYVAYHVSLFVAGTETVALLAGVVFFVVGLALSGKILTVVSSVLGALILLDVMLAFNIVPEAGVVVSGIAAVAGVVYQNRSRARYQGAATTSPAGNQ